MTNKIDGKNSFTKRKVAYALFGVIALLVLFLCIGVLRRVVYGVFGYAIYAYLPALLTFAVMLLIGKKPNSRQGPWTPGADILEDEWQFVVQLLSYV